MNCINVNRRSDHNKIERIMTNQPTAIDQPTVLDQWKAMAEIENKRARQTWGGPGKQYVPPKSAFDSDGQIARDQRDDKIREMAEDGVTTKDICEQIGLSETTVNRILRRHKT